MKRPLLIGSLLVLVAAVLSILSVRKEEFLVSERPAAPEDSEMGSSKAEEPESLSAASDTSVPLRSEHTDTTPTAADLERDLPKRFAVERIQSTAEGFEAELEIDGLPLLGARLFVSSNDKGIRHQIIPALQKPPSGTHTRSFDAEVESKAQKEASLLEKCKILSIGKSRQIWFNANDAGVLPAYAIEIYGICSRERKREDWIYRDPDLEKIGRVLKRN